MQSSKFQTTSPLNDASSRCTRAVKEAVGVFTISMGRASIPSDTAPWDILSSTLEKASKAFELDSDFDLTSAEALHRVLQATFDTNTQAFLSEDSSTVFDHLTRTQKDRIIAQAIAAVLVVFQRLAMISRSVTKGILNREAQLFAESDQRTHMLDVIEHSHLFENCYMQSQISDMILAAMKEEPASVSRSKAMDESNFIMSTAPICERPENMGLPWGFTVMALN